MNYVKREKNNQLERIKEIECDLLVAFIDCCTQLGLRYFLVGGSMLGAVRHKGFIPWDDDIDVGMLRADYEVFLEKAQALLPEYYFVQCRKTDPELPNNFAKLRDSRTTFIESSVKDKKINHGIYIDIFPFDYYPENPKEQKRFKAKNRILTLRIRETFTLPEQNRHNPVLEFAAGVVAKLLSFKYKSVHQALDERETLYKSVGKSRFVSSYCGAYGEKDIIPLEWVSESITGTFEGIQVKIPKEFDKYLTQLYGHYMQYPPVSQRVPHHYTEVIDTERPYTDYI